jgi:hypothetical protein
MGKEPVYLKDKNNKYLWLFIGVNTAIFLSISIGTQLTYSTVEHYWLKVSAKDGLIAICIPLVTVVLNGLLGDLAKARIVFWRWNDPLPGCRAFTELIHIDPRIDVNALKARHGNPPEDPKQQNALWYKLYKKHAGSVIVSEAHKIYLLTRDMTALSVLFVVFFTAGTSLSPVDGKIIGFYFVALLAQYLILSTSARNYGTRFVLNVLVAESYIK